MPLDRRRLLLSGSAGLASCALGARPRQETGTRLDRLLAAHADGLPERAGAGANHYPMAAEALETLGHDERIEEDWVAGASLYTGRAGRRAPILAEQDVAPALGDYERYGDWLDLFRSELARAPWGEVVNAWTPGLAPGLCGAAFHGLIRTGHAARALRRRDTAARRDELAVGLAYWAARWTELPAAEGDPTAGAPLVVALSELDHPWLDDTEPVAFAEVNERLTRAPIAPPVALDVADPRAELDALVSDASTAFLEMLVQERYRIWLLHTVTGPGAVGLLLPDVDPPSARTLVAHARQAVVALYAAYGAPFAPRAHVRPTPPDWPTLVERASQSGSVHTIKLLEALRRFDAADDPLYRSVAIQWLEWT